MTVTAEIRQPTQRPQWRRGLRPLLWVGAALVAVVALRGRIPDPAAILAVIRAADPRWLGVALLAQFLSQAAFARQQRTLLSALGVNVPARDMLDITYSRSAMSMVFPAGSAASAAYALQQFRRRGATTGAAAAVMLLSGIASAAGLGALYLTTAGPTGWLIGAGIVAVGVTAWVAKRTRRTPAQPSTPARLRWPWLNRLTEQLRDAAREARLLSTQKMVFSIGFAVLNWLLDLACLVAVAQACGVPLDWHQLATVYFAVQIARQIPLTPGGIGLIEASLLTGFVAAGASEAGAAALVIGYRIMSFWLMIPAGLLAYLRLGRATADRVAQPTGA